MNGERIQAAVSRTPAEEESPEQPESPEENKGPWLKDSFAMGLAAELYRLGLPIGRIGRILERRGYTNLAGGRLGNSNFDTSVNKRARKIKEGPEGVQGYFDS